MFVANREINLSIFDDMSSTFIYNKIKYTIALFKRKLYMSPSFTFPQASFERREWNGMEMNENNNFIIFFPFLIQKF